MVSSFGGRATRPVPAGSYVRHDVSFLSAGVRCAAWLYLPAAGVRPPLVVMGHGLGATRQMRLDAYASRFTQAGMAVLVFDYRYLGDSEGAPRQLIDIRKQLDDWHAALAYARTLSCIDRTRIALWGSSFGGGHVLQAAAEDRSVRAVISQAPFTDGVASTLARARAGLLSSGVLMIAAVVDAIGAKLHARPVLMPMAGTWWMPAFLASADSIKGATDQARAGTQLSRRTSMILRRLPSVRRRLSDTIELSDLDIPRGMDSIWGVMKSPDNSSFTVNAITARLALSLPFYRPGRALKQLGAIPVLICACDNDSVAPVKPTLRAAKGLSQVRVIRYPYGHFEIYVGEAFEHALTDQLNFLHQNLG